MEKLALPQTPNQVTVPELPQIEANITSTGVQQLRENGQLVSREHVANAWEAHATASAEANLEAEQKLSVFDKAAELAADPDFKDKPLDLAELGASKSMLKKWGYHLELGDAGKFKEDVTAWKAHKDAEAEKAAKEAARNERRSEAEAKHAAWTKEQDDYRAKRDAGTEAVEKLSYKAKLENGGSLALDKDPKLAKKLRDEAIVEAEAKGHHVSHLKEAVKVVPQNKAAEARQTSLAEALKAHQSEVLRAQLNRNASEAGQSEETTAVEMLPIDVDGEEWEPIEGFETQGAGNHTVYFEDEPNGATAATTQEKGIKGRLSSAWLRANMYVSNKAANLAARVGEAMHKDEDGERKLRRGRAALAVGAVAAGVLATVYLSKNGIHFGKGNHSHAHEALKPGGNARGGHPAEVLTPSGATRGAAETMPGTVSSAAPAPAEAVQHVTEQLTRKGDTIWAHAQTRLGGNASQSQIQAEAQRILDLNHMSWEDARHLAEGTEFLV